MSSVGSSGIGGVGVVGVDDVDERFKKELGRASQRARIFLNDHLRQTLVSTDLQLSEDDRKFPDDSLAAIALQQELWRNHHPMLPDKYGPAVLEVLRTLEGLAQADLAQAALARADMSA
jgi:hypothetical protein